MTVSFAGGPTFQTENNWAFQGGVVQTGSLTFAYEAASSSSTDGSPRFFFQFADNNCPNAAAVLATLGGGPTTISWQITLADGSVLQQSVIWNLVL